jgi:hypothetical protein
VLGKLEKTNAYGLERFKELIGKWKTK